MSTNYNEVQLSYGRSGFNEQFNEPEQNHDEKQKVDQSNILSSS